MHTYIHAYISKHAHTYIPAVKGLDVVEFEHVSVDKCALDLLIGPADEQLVVLPALQMHALLPFI
jgi:hypothetical protein